MIKPKRGALPSLRLYLLSWFAGCAILMVIAYTQLLEYYLDLGIHLRTQSLLEQTAVDYTGALDAGRKPELPTGRSLAAYLDYAAIPSQLRRVFPVQRREHQEVVRFTNLDFEDGEKLFRVDTLDLCPEGSCDLVFLYSYRTHGDEWLYLFHGIVGSDEIYDELELTEQVAFAIGSVFAGLLILVSFLVVRNIDRPLRNLDRWSEAQSTERSDPLPDLRFREFDGLAQRLESAFERMREGVNKEKLFLRHASHELRTPIAILSSNVELMDRLTDRPERSAEEQASFVRQYRALSDVRLLIETLLWINRQSDKLPASERLDLRAELDAIVEQHRHLLDARDVTLTVTGGDDADGSSHGIVAPAAAVRIVLSNLLRNAFQYTTDGEVVIIISPGQVSIENTSLAETDPPSASGSAGPSLAESDGEYGFGLGLELVTLICRRFEWRCTSVESPRGRLTTVNFEPTAAGR